MTKEKQRTFEDGELKEPKPQKKEQRDPYKTAFNKRKAELHSTYKKFKVGMINGENLTDEERFLLTKYYGVRYEE